MLEITTANGFRRSIHVSLIATVGEINGGGRSNTVITLSTGETLFAVDSYDVVTAKYKELTQQC